MRSSNWIRPVILAASCLIIGFVGGWSLANIGGDSVSLPEAKVDVTVQEPAPATTTIETPTEQVPDRAAVVVQILNGTTTNGLAGRTATQLKSVGYTKVSVDTASPRTGASVVYYRDGAKPAADRLATDLQIASVAALAGTPLAGSAQGSAQLVVVLGPG